eukprot:TRINITY_DN5809_c0_g2_i1.p1 TRINITY_DN5809_c0_g2~~TRINITY_DN5809_c0_g2_i1.p1  ORF type:complete len:288 (+),score=52.48 TRINITY_DN5809_c0_g2_i1:70-933(+)
MKFISATFLLILASVYGDQSDGQKRVMPWMCLEKCGQNISSIQSDLKELILYKESVTGVSFEAYELGPNAEFVVENITEVGPFLSGAGFETYGMISSCVMCPTAVCCYPSDFLERMRKLFNNPTPFINAALAEISDKGYTGYNVDMEPTAGATEEDAQNYAAFLSEFADALHAIDKKLTVDIANWNPIWNWTLISQSSVDRIFLMSTYAGNFTAFEKYLKQAVNEIDPQKLGIGLETIDDDTNEPFSEAELQERFQMLAEYDIQEIDLWRTPIPLNFCPFIEDFLAQ